MKLYERAERLRQSVDSERATEKTLRRDLAKAERLLRDETESKAVAPGSGEWKDVRRNLTIAKDYLDIARDIYPSGPEHSVHANMIERAQRVLYRASETLSDKARRHERDPRRPLRVNRLTRAASRRSAERGRTSRRRSR